MIDHQARQLIGRIFEPLAAVCPISALAVTGFGLVAGLGSAASAASELWLLALGLWLFNRFLDGLDGAVARIKNTQSDLGGYLDMLADVVVYAAVPLGVAASQDDRGSWAAAGVLVAMFYVNIVAWLYLSALLEKRQQGASASGERTAVTMPRGLVEGTETIAFFSFLLLVPSVAVWTMAVMAVAVGLSVGMQVRGAVRLLHSSGA